MVFILQMERFESSSKAPVEGCPAAAGGRKRQDWLSAAVEKRKEKRKPAAFFGHRKAGKAGAQRLRGLPSVGIRSQFSAFRDERPLRPEH